MRVEDILNAKGRSVVTAPPNATVAKSVSTLAEYRIGALVICGGDGKLLGVISERDIIIGLAERGPDALGLTAVDLMSPVVHSCTPLDSLSHVMREMTRWHVRHLPVLDKGQLCGLISIGDAVKHRLDEMNLEVRVLRDAYLAAQVGCAPSNMA